MRYVFALNEGIYPLNIILTRLGLLISMDTSKMYRQSYRLLSYCLFGSYVGLDVLNSDIDTVQNTKRQKKN